MPTADVLDAIPHRPPFLFVDEVLSSTANSLTAQRTFRAEEDFYAGHYPGAPITPGVLLCEAVFQTGAVYLSRKQRAAGGALNGVPLLAKIGEVRFRNPVFPGDTVQITVTEKEVLAGFYMMAGSVVSGSKRILTVEFSVAWKVPEGGAQKPA